MPARTHERVYFGATVTVADESGAERTVSIVGVDEIDPGRGRVSWISPIATALLKASVGDVVTLRTPRGTEELEILDDPLRRASVESAARTEAGTSVGSSLVSIRDVGEHFDDAILLGVAQPREERQREDAARRVGGDRQRAAQIAEALPVVRQLVHGGEMQAEADARRPITAAMNALRSSAAARAAMRTT